MSPKKILWGWLGCTLTQIPPPLAAYQLQLSGQGAELVYTYDESRGRSGIADLLKALGDASGNGSVDFADFLLLSRFFGSEREEAEG